MNTDAHRCKNKNTFLFYLCASVFIGGYLILFTGCAASNKKQPAPSVATRIPVILDTDIGNDIDDNFALVCLLHNPRFDIKLITTTDGQRDFRARIIARLLTAAGRTDIPIGLAQAKKPAPAMSNPGSKISRSRNTRAKSMPTASAR